MGTSDRLALIKFDPEAEARYDQKIDFVILAGIARKQQQEALARRKQQHDSHEALAGQLGAYKMW